MAARDIDIIAAGDLNADLILTDVGRPVAGEERLAGQGRLSVGGSAGIFATNAARLGLRIAMAAVVGADAVGDWLLEELRRAGVETAAVRRDPRRATGISVALQAPRSHDKALLTYPGALAETSAAQVLPLLKRARHLHVASYFLLSRLQASAPTLLRRARRLGLSTSLDPNPDPTRRYRAGIHAALAETDYFLPNRREAAGIGAHRAGATIVKDGGRGAEFRQGRLRLRVPAAPARVVETTGAGDSFDAGFIAALLRGLPMRAALEFAARCAAAACAAPGGTTAMAGAAGDRLRQRLERLARAVAARPA